MIIQILNGGVDPSWLILVLAGVVAFFLVRTLNHMEARMNKQDARAKIVTNVLLQMLTRLGGDDSFYNELSDQLNQE